MWLNLERLLSTRKICHRKADRLGCLLIKRNHYVSNNILDLLHEPHRSRDIWLNHSSRVPIKVLGIHPYIVSIRKVGMSPCITERADFEIP